jgi:hypothetical protein
VLLLTASLLTGYVGDAPAPLPAAARGFRPLPASGAGVTEDALASTWFRIGPA